MDKIKCYIVSGFIDAGKTTYIQENIFRDFFHKRGSTLILSFEDGEVSYDEERLAAFRTYKEQYTGGETIPAFCLSRLEKHKPDRVFIEANAMTDGLISELSKLFLICDRTVLFDGETFPVYFQNMRQLVQNMVTDANMVIFQKCASKEPLSPFATDLRLMNDRCTYLWESPLGYSEQAFGLSLPYSLDTDSLSISEKDFPIWFLDVKRTPSHYFGKTVKCTLNIRLRNDLLPGHFIAGKLLMPCCPADMQFCGVECINETGLTLKDNDTAQLVLKGAAASNSSGIIFSATEIIPS